MIERDRRDGDERVAATAMFLIPILGHVFDEAAERMAADEVGRAFVCANGDVRVNAVRSVLYKLGVHDRTWLNEQSGPALILFQGTGVRVIQTVEPADLNKVAADLTLSLFENPRVLLGLRLRI